MGNFAGGFWRQGPRLIGRGVPLVAVAVIAVFNGSLHGLVFEEVAYSPVYDSVSQYVSSFASGSWFDGFVHGVLAAGPQLYQSLTSLLIAAMTLLIAGIPAAVYERLRGLEASTPVSLGIWLACAVLLTLPTILKAVSGDEF
jgi:hypothetical protein